MACPADIAAVTGHSVQSGKANTRTIPDRYYTTRAATVQWYSWEAERHCEGEKRMGIVTTTIDALRRVGTPTQKSAIQRQDEYVQDRTVINRRSATLRSELGQTSAFVATVTPSEDIVSPLSSEDLVPIQVNADRVESFLAAFSTPTASTFFVERLDEAFAQWITAADQRGYSNDDVIEITGAAFGRFCVDTLDLHWVELVDPHGRSLAVEREGGRVRGFPFEAVAKRIRTHEFGFFKAIYIALQDAVSRG